MTVSNTQTNALALSIIPLTVRDDQASRLQASFLAYRYTGFTIPESLDKVGCSTRDLNKWRNDEEFSRLENGIRDSDTRNSIRQEIVRLRFTRNMIMILDKDEQVLRKALGLEKDEDGDVIPMTKEDLSYMNRLRANYSPTMLEGLNKVAKAELTQFNINELILNQENVEVRNDNQT